MEEKFIRIDYLLTLKVYEFGKTNELIKDISINYIDTDFMNDNYYKDFRIEAILNNMQERLKRDIFYPSSFGLNYEIYFLDIMDAIKHIETPKFSLILKINMSERIKILNQNFELDVNLKPFDGYNKEICVENALKRLLNEFIYGVNFNEISAYLQGVRVMTNEDIEKIQYRCYSPYKRDIEELKDLQKIEEEAKQIIDEDIKQCEDTFLGCYIVGYDYKIVENIEYFGKCVLPIYIIVEKEQWEKLNLSQENKKAFLKQIAEKNGLNKVFKLRE